MIPFLTISPLWQMKSLIVGMRTSLFFFRLYILGSISLLRGVLTPRDSAPCIIRPSHYRHKCCIAENVIKVETISAKRTPIVDQRKTDHFYICLSKVIRPRPRGSNVSGNYLKEIFSRLISTWLHIHSSYATVGLLNISVTEYVNIDSHLVELIQERICISIDIGSVRLN